MCVAKTSWVGPWRKPAPSLFLKAFNIPRSMRTVHRNTTVVHINDPSNLKLCALYAPPTLTAWFCAFGFSDAFQKYSIRPCLSFWCSRCRLHNYFWKPATRISMQILWIGLDSLKSQHLFFFWTRKIPKERLQPCSCTDRKKLWTIKKGQLDDFQCLILGQTYGLQP